jgi:hypothetical protein
MRMARDASGRRGKRKEWKPRPGKEERVWSLFVTVTADASHVSRLLLHFPHAPTPAFSLQNNAQVSTFSSFLTLRALEATKQKSLIPERSIYVCASNTLYHPYHPIFIHFWISA